MVFSGLVVYCLQDLLPRKDIARVWNDRIKYLSPWFWFIAFTGVWGAGGFRTHAWGRYTGTTISPKCLMWSKWMLQNRPGHSRRHRQGFFSFFLNSRLGLLEWDRIPVKALLTTCSNNLLVLWAKLINTILAQNNVKNTYCALQSMCCTLNNPHLTNWYHDQCIFLRVNFK